mgnify:CR=1 FL=1
MIIVKGNAGFCDASQIVAAFVKTNVFQTNSRFYSVQVDLQGVKLSAGFTLARYYNKVEAQAALDALAKFLATLQAGTTTIKVFDFNRVENKEDK